MAHSLTLCRQRREERDSSTSIRLCLTPLLREFSRASAINRAALISLFYLNLGSRRFKLRSTRSALKHLSQIRSCYSPSSLINEAKERICCLDQPIFCNASAKTSLKKWDKVTIDSRYRWRSLSCIVCPR